MASRIALLQNDFFESLSDGWKLVLQNMHKHVPGVKTLSAKSIDNLMALIEEHRGVLLIPIDISYKNSIENYQRELNRNKPYSFFFGALFIVMDSSTHPKSGDSLQEPFWIEKLDEFYDQAIPVQVIACLNFDTNAHVFNLASGLSGLFRQIESLEELKRLGAAVSELEQKTSQLEEKF